MKLNAVYNEDCRNTMKRMDADSVYCVVTSPPYDDMRYYDGLKDVVTAGGFDWQGVADGLYRVMKPGGVAVWIVSDSHKKHDESGTSFRQALYFKEKGFLLHDTMIWVKTGISNAGQPNCYHSAFEYMFVFAKDRPPKTTNMLADRRNVSGGTFVTGKQRQKDGSMALRHGEGTKIKKFGKRYNVWLCHRVSSSLERGHPAPFPEKLVSDHLRTWSNPGDVVYDPFLGGGTTALASLSLERQFVGSEISAKYCRMAERRIRERTRALGKFV